ncbi:MAG: hypothetical protein KDD53_08145, partial [Bdellovibrionales bacterium]|nr:hypothetical protein [Bdellovibrionales bacterium]
LKIRSSLSLQGNPFIQGDAHFLSQAFRNLLLNAKQAIGTNGEIKISAQDLDPADRGIRITISDSGPGIEPEILEAIFEPFVTRKQEGTGLGLAIVKTIVTRHGGRISATNDCGAKFFVELPRKQANSPTSGSAI